MADDLIQIPGYEMKRELGEGGMARVFLATQLSLGREVAIKVLRNELAAGAEDFKKRFLHEGQMLAKLVHNNIVAIYDIANRDDVSYMAMEYLKGGTLTDRIKIGLTLEEVLRFTTQIAMALDLAHRNNIVHRDLKPSNIMFRDELTPVLTDFGIARKTDSEHRLTKTGMVVGTPYYMSPEQITGREIDGRSDIYSLGIMFYELLVGELPFRAEEPLALAMQHVQEPPPPLPADMKDLQPLMDGLLAKKADDRFQTMPEFVGAVKELVLNDATFAARLSSDTRIFDSEQLTDPAFKSGARTGRTGRLKSRSTGQRQARTGGATSVLRSGEQPVRRRGWALPAVAVLLIAALGVGGFLVMNGDGGLELSEQDQALIADLLNKANAHLTLGETEKAVARLEEVIAITDRHPEAQKLADQIATTFHLDASVLVRRGSLDEARALIDRGLALAPEHPALSELSQDLEVRIATAERQAEIQRLLAAGETAEAEGRLIEPTGDNAYETFQAVRALDRANQAAIDGLQRIEDSLIQSAQAALAAGRLAEAERIGIAARERFGNSNTINGILQTVSDRLRRMDEQEQIDGLLAAAQEQLDRGRYVTPPGDNALESYLAVLQLRPTQPGATQGLQLVAAHFLTEARTAFDAGDFSQSAEAASFGLRALPDDPRLLEIQRQATSRLDAKARQLEQDLQRAERLVSEGQFLSGPDGGARAAYEQVVASSPGNLRARAALARLPDQVYMAATQLQRDGNFVAASGLLQEATRAYPEDARFTDLLTDVEQQLSQQQRRLRLDQLLAESARLVAIRPVTRASFDQALDAISAILADYEDNVAAPAQLAELAAALADEADRLSSQGNFDAALRLLDHGLGRLTDNNRLLTARTAIVDQRERQLEEERRALLARMGQLAIDAKPWGEVLEIRDAEGNRTELPPDATTPLVVSLLEGEYSVLVRAAAGGGERRLDVSVQRQDLVMARADFEGMSADAYFERSGW